MSPPALCAWWCPPLGSGPASTANGDTSQDQSTAAPADHYPTGAVPSAADTAPKD